MPPNKGLDQTQLNLLLYTSCMEVISMCRFRSSACNKETSLNLPSPYYLDKQLVISIKVYTLDHNYLVIFCRWIVVFSYAYTLCLRYINSTWGYLFSNRYQVICESKPGYFRNCVNRNSSKTPPVLFKFTT